MQVKDIMTARPELVNRRATLQETARKMHELNVGVLPVVDRGHLVGMVTDRDLAVRGVALGLHPTATWVEAVMTPDVVSCLDTDDVHVAAELMARCSVRRVVVVNAKGKPVGILSVDDLANRASDDRLVAEALHANPAT